MASETPADDVTTIFVVGFPDDMTEREFQNMFIFSTGFEAASLKWHCKDQEDDAQAGSGSGIGKKQMIGFARFRTRQEAMEAVEVLNGKRVDQERGMLLKAEMAKKNLHIKRGSIAPTTANFPPQHPALPPAMPNAPIAPNDVMPKSIFAKRMSVSHHDTFSPLLSDLLSPLDYPKHDPFAGNPFSNSTPTTPIFNDPVFGFRSPSFDARSDMGFMSPLRGFGLAPPPRLMSFQDNAADTDPFHYLSKSSPAPNEREFDPTSSILNDLPPFHDTPGARVGSFSFQPLSSHSANLTELRSQSFSSASGRSFNPADQNPPCNTLYVGNLPPNTNEEELRQLFSKCRGYKRMSFPTKSQGPMCFVEFEDVLYATQAMNELQGHCLTNSVKGGIRLSFSKNPLFTKPNKQVATDRKDLFSEHPLENIE